MENQFFVDSEYLSPKALEKKHRLETDPSFRKNHMEYLPGMEQIESDVCKNVMIQMQKYDYSWYIANDIRTALEHDGRKGKAGNQQAFWEYGVSVYASLHCKLL